MTISRILIAIEDDKYAEHAAEYGFGLARTYNAEVGLVSIVDPLVFTPAGADGMTGLPVDVPILNAPELIKIQSDSAENLIAQTIKKFAGDLKVTPFSDYGSKADGIIRCSNEFNADLIIIGTHSRTGLDRLLMGSVAGDVVRHSQIPVLVVPLKESESQ
jgi:nucleotide-binding universal stress UspA family protein